LQRTKPDVAVSDGGICECDEQCPTDVQRVLTMKLNYLPLLNVQRELHEIPRGPDRFQRYLRTMLTPDGNDVELPPLGIMNPMGKDHVTKLLDDLLALDADQIGARAAHEAAHQLDNVPAEFKISLVLADDAMGGGTNRYAYEFELRFGPPKLRTRRPKYDWITAVLWSSALPSERAVRETVMTAVFRSAYIIENGPPQTLREMLIQEGRVMARAGCTTPVLDLESIVSTRETVAAHLDAMDMRAAIECLFGDVAADSLGFTPRGLAPWAGIALALHDARAHRTQSL
jgi:hypothetical protein